MSRLAAASSRNRDRSDGNSTIEHLEQRRHFAGSAGIGPNGDLVISGASNVVATQDPVTGKTSVSLDGGPLQEFNTANITGKIDVTGTGGQDTIDLSGCSTPCKVNGGDGGDTILTGSGADEIDAGDGNDSVNAGAGDDVIYGKDGNDIITPGDGCDKAFGGYGDDAFVSKDDGDIDFYYGGDGLDKHFYSYGGMFDYDIADGDVEQVVSLPYGF